MVCNGMSTYVHLVLVVWCISLVRAMGSLVVTTTGGGVVLSTMSYMVSLLMLLAVVQDTDCACRRPVHLASSLVTPKHQRDAFPRTHSPHQQGVLLTTILHRDTYCVM